MKSFKEWYELKESMSVYIQDRDFQSDIRDLDDIANVLKNKLIYPLWNKLSEEQKQDIIKGESNSHGFIVPDGDYYLDPKHQVLNFYTKGWPENILSNITQGIKYYLDEMGIKYGEFKTEQSGMYRSPVIRIPILQFSATKNIPPNLNMSNDNAILIFKDLLGFPNEEGGFFNIAATDLYRRIEELESYKLDLHARDSYMQQSKGGGKFFSGGLSKEEIAQRLEQIKQIAKWAMDNHYDTLYVA